MELPSHLLELQCPDLETAAEAALLAGQIILERFGGKLMLLSSKSPGDYVTEVDKEAEAAIVSRLRCSGVTEDQIVSEESHSELPEKRDDLWIIDPLDATSSYIFRCGQQYPSVMIARIVNAETTVAVIYFPLLGELFYAIHDRGCRLSIFNDRTWYRGHRLKLWTPCQDLSTAWVVLNRHANAAEETKEIRKLDQVLRSTNGAGLLTCEVPNSGIACRVATGQIGAAIHDNSPYSRKQRCWDMAAPALILKEAGGVFCNLMGAPVNIWKYEPIIAAQSEALMVQILCKLNS